MRFVLVPALAVLIVGCSAQAPGAPPAGSTTSPALARPASLQALLDAALPAIRPAPASG